MRGRSAAWRTGNVGRLLAVAADAFVRDKLRVVHADGFHRVAQVHMALIQNLDCDGTRLTRIAARARMTKQSMLELVDKVEAMGFVERRPDPADGRAKTVAFTPAGLIMLDRLRQGVLAAERRMAAVVGAGFLAEMKDALSAYVADADPGVAADLCMSDGNAAWRMRNAGRVLVSAFGVFSRDVLRHLHDSGFDQVAEVHLTLFRNLEEGGTRLTEIAALARMTKQAMSELVAKSEMLGLVGRVPDPNDARAKTIVFTPMGRRVLDALRQGVTDAEGDLAKATGEPFATQLRTRLSAYVTAVHGPDGEVPGGLRPGPEAPAGPVA